MIKWKIVYMNHEYVPRLECMTVEGYNVVNALDNFTAFPKERIISIEAVPQEILQ